MAEFALHDETSAPEESAKILANAKKANGFIPNLFAVMAEAPGLLSSYQFIHQQFVNSSFDADELTVVWQAINVEHDCGYCVPAHTRLAQGMSVDNAILDALRDETPLPNARLEALRTFTLVAVRTRGVANEVDVNAFLAAGYTERHILEVILGLSQKVMSNYTNHFAKTPVDPAFWEFSWNKVR